MPGETVLNGNQEWVVQADLPLTAAIRQSQQTLYHSHPPHPADRQGESWPGHGCGGFLGGALARWGRHGGCSGSGERKPRARVTEQPQRWTSDAGACHLLDGTCVRLPLSSTYLPLASS